MVGILNGSIYVGPVVQMALEYCYGKSRNVNITFTYKAKKGKIWFSSDNLIIIEFKS